MCHSRHTGSFVLALEVFTKVHGKTRFARTVVSALALVGVAASGMALADRIAAPVHTQRHRQRQVRTP